MKITRFITGLTAAVMLTSAAAFPELPAPALIKDSVIAAQAAELTENDISTELYAMTKDGEKVLIGSGSGSHYSIKNIRLGYYDIAGYDFTGFQLEASLPELPAGSVGKIDIGGSYTISYWKEDMSDTAAVFARDGVEIKSSTKKATVKLSIDELYIDSLDFSVDYKNLRFEKEQQSISGATVKVSDKVYTGKALTPEVSVTLDGKRLSSGKDYTVKYSNNTEPGSGRVVVAGTGDYKGSVTKTFAISPKQTTIKSAKSAKKKTAKITWAKNTHSTGFQILLSTRKDFRSGNKTVWVKSNTAAAKTVKGLKSGKKYYVKIRAYKTVGKTKLWGKYSKLKSVKVK